MSFLANVYDMTVDLDEADLPLRLLDDFSVSIGGQYTSLDNLGSPGFHGMTACGSLVAQPSLRDRSANSGVFKVQDFMHSIFSETYPFCS